MHTGGISYEGDVLDLALAQKLIVRSGAWFRYGDLHLGQGREKTRAYLQENPALLEELKRNCWPPACKRCRAGGEAAAARVKSAAAMRGPQGRRPASSWLREAVSSNRNALEGQASHGKINPSRDTDARR